MSLHLFLLFLHLLAIFAWVGGMFFMLICLQPAASFLLEPASRLPLLHAVLGRFFRWVTLAIVVILVSGVAMMMDVGFVNAPNGWRWMAGTGIVMMLAFGHTYAACYRRLGRAVTAADWPAAGIAMNGIRRLLILNLALGILTIAFATLGSGFK